MADVFISYAREDRPWVEKLAAQLQTEGFSVWWDWDLLVGKRYRETIDTELQSCKAAVVVWSQFSVRSDFVRDEAEEAQQRNVLLPVLKEAVRPPAGFRQIQSADLSNWSGEGSHDELRRVMKGVAHMVGRPTGGVANKLLSDSVSTDDQRLPSVDLPNAVQPVGMSASRPAEARPAVSAVPRVASPRIRFRFPNLWHSGLTAGSNRKWFYLVVGAVALLVVVYSIIQVSSLFSSTSDKSAHQGSGAIGTRSDASSTAAPVAGEPTNTTSLRTDVAAVIRHAETSDRNARARAALAVEQRKLADAASARARQGANASFGVLNGQDSSGIAFTFAGEISEGTEEGVGAAALSNGSHYSGQWNSGSAQGLGVFDYANGDQYSGEFDENLQSGLGTVKFADKSKGLGYSGQWVSGAYQGFGVYYFQDGTRLEGLWHEGQLRGLGARFSREGKVLEQGIYENSVLKR